MGKNKKKTKNVERPNGSNSEPQTESNNSQSDMSAASLTETQMTGQQKRPLSEGTPPGGGIADTKRQRGGGDEVNSSVFELNAASAPSGAPTLTSTPAIQRGGSGNVGDGGGTKDMLTEELRRQLNDVIRQEDLGLEGAGAEIAGATVVMNNFMSKILPVFLNFVVDKVTQAVRGDLLPTDRNNRQTPRDVNIDKLQKVCLDLKHQTDANEQYSRRESVRIFGLEEGTWNETPQALENKVLKVFRDAGARVGANDISVMHRVGKKGRVGASAEPVDNQAQEGTGGEEGEGGVGVGEGGEGQSDNDQNNTSSQRPVIVRFISRQKKQEVMMSKKNLKTKAGYNKTYIHEDITRLRAKMLHFVKEVPGIGRVWTREGLIYCKRKGPNNTVVGNPIGPIENVTHLRNLLGVEITPALLEKLGLGDMVV